MFVRQTKPDSNGQLQSYYSDQNSQEKTCAKRSFTPKVKSLPPPENASGLSNATLKEETKELNVDQKRKQLFAIDHQFLNWKSVAYFQSESGFVVQDIVRLSFYEEDMVALQPICYAEGLFVRWDDEKKLVDAMRIVVCRPLTTDKCHETGVHNLTYVLPFEQQHIDKMSEFMGHSSYVVRLFEFQGKTMNPDVENGWYERNNRKFVASQEFSAFQRTTGFLNKIVQSLLTELGYHFVFRKNYRLPYLTEENIQQLMHFDSIKNPKSEDFPQFFGKPLPLGFLPHVYRYVAKNASFN